MALSTGLQTYLYSFERGGARVICPLAERNVGGFTDIVTPYGFSGFAGIGAPDDFPNHWSEFVHDQGYVCGYIGLNPAFDDVHLYDKATRYSHNNLFLMDLTPPVSEIYGRLSTNRKRQLRDWDRTLDHIVLDQEVLTSFLVANCAKFLRSKGAPSVYGFTDATLSSLSQLGNVFLVGIGDEYRIDAVSVFAHTPFVGDYLFNISRPEGRHHAVSLLWYGLKHLKSSGIPTLNLGGGIRMGDSVAEFKRRFGAQERPLNCLKQVYRPEIYAELCRGVGTDPDDRTGYFPAYRG